jgi:FtsZ-binding cell division protein ZapB
METKHTPLPWKVGPTGYRLEAEGYGIVADFAYCNNLEEAKANAAFALEAVNAHAALVARVAELEEENASWQQACGDIKEKCDTLHAELATLKSECERLRVDAERYRKLRMWDWFDGPLCVLRDPKKVFARGSALGADCPSQSRLDEAIDAALNPTSSAKEANHG